MKLSPAKIWKVSFLAAMLAGFVFSFQAVQAAGITADAVIGLVNQARTKNNLQPLFDNKKLDAAASQKAADMIANNYFAHNSPQGITPWAWFARSGYDYKYAGENLAMGFANPTEQQQAWMDSADHRKNILSGNYEEIGIAVKQGMINGQLTTITVQEFGSRADFVAPVQELSDNALPAQESGSVLGAAQGNSLNLAAGNNLVSSLSSIIKNTAARLAALDWNKNLGNGAAGALELAVIGGMLVAGYLAADTLVVAYLRKQKEKSERLALYTVSPEEYLDSLKRMSIDASKFQIIYLQQMKPRK